jgi:hypothetical protein
MEAHIAEHLSHEYRQDIQAQMGVELPPMGEPLPPEIENRVSSLVAQAATRLKKQHQAEAAQQQAQQIAEDPVFQLRVREVEIKEKALNHQMEKDAASMMLDISKTVSKEEMDKARLHSEEVRAGAKIGADLVTFGAQLQNDQRQEAFKLGSQAISEIQQASGEHTRMAHERVTQDKQHAHERKQNELERDHKLQVAKAKRPAPRVPK